MTPPPLDPNFASAFTGAHLVVFPPPGTASDVFDLLWPIPIPPTRVEPSSPSDGPATRLIADLVTEAEDKATWMTWFLRGYQELFARLGVGPDGYADYLRAERNVLARLYAAVREPVPSPTGVRSLILQYTLDARRPLPPPIDRFVYRQRSGVWEIGEYPPAAYRTTVLPPPSGYQPVVSSFARLLLSATMVGRIDAVPVIELIEALFGGPPRPVEVAAEPAISATRAPEPLPDGPDEPFTFRWRGVEIDLSRAALRHRLLIALWDAVGRRPHKSREAGDVMAELWPDDDAADDRSKDVHKKVNCQFEEHGLPLVVVLRGGKIWLHVRPD